MTESKKSAVGEIFADPTAGRLDFMNARVIAYSVAGEMDTLQTLVAEAQERYKTSRSPEARTRAALTAGVGLWIMCKFPEALAALEPVKEHPDGAYFLGLCQIELKDYDGAVRSFRRAAQAGQDAFACAMGEVEALRLAGNRDEAMSKIRGLQKSHDGEAELHYQKGRCLEETLEYEAAMEEFERAVELNPQHAGALFRLAYWHDLRGNDNLAREYYEKAAAIRPLRTGVMLNLGMLYEDHGEYEKAAQMYRRVLAANPLDPRARMFVKDAEASLEMYYDEAAERRQHRMAAVLRMPLSEFELSSRSRAQLEKMNIRTLGDLARLTEEELGGARNFGEASLAELRSLLESKGLHFGMGRKEPQTSAAAIGAPAQGDVLQTPVTSLDLSVRSIKCMRTLGIETVGQLIQKTDKELLECPNFGTTSLNEIKRKLAALGLALKPRE